MPKRTCGPLEFASSIFIQSIDLLWLFVFLLFQFTE